MPLAGSVRSSADEASALADAFAPAVVAPAFTIAIETPGDEAAREYLLDAAMGPGRKRKSSEKLRRGRLPSPGLAFVARDPAGRVVGTVRLWDVAVGLFSSPCKGEVARRAGGGVAQPHPPASQAPSPCRGGKSALLLGPLAVDPAMRSAGIGGALMRHAIDEARRLGHGAILLVGDPEYYARFGFSAGKTGALAMPGPFEKRRLLALELVDGWLDGAKGVIAPVGRRIERVSPADGAARFARVVLARSKKVLKPRSTGSLFPVATALTR